MEGAHPNRIGPFFPPRLAIWWLTSCSVLAVFYINCSVANATKQAEKVIRKLFFPPEEIRIFADYFEMWLTRCQAASKSAGTGA